MLETFFKESSYKDHVLENLYIYAKNYRDEGKRLITLSFAKFKKGLEQQKWVILGFGSTSYDSTGNVLKLCEFPDKSILTNTPIYNQQKKGMLVCLIMNYR